MERKGGGLSDKLVRNLCIIKTLRIKDTKVDTAVGKGEWLFKRIRSSECPQV